VDCACAAPNEARVTAKQHPIPKLTARLRAGSSCRAKHRYMRVNCFFISQNCNSSVYSSNSSRHDEPIRPTSAALITESEVCRNNGDASRAPNNYATFFGLGMRGVANERLIICRRAGRASKAQHNYDQPAFRGPASCGVATDEDASTKLAVGHGGRRCSRLLARRIMLRARRTG
jgi:hypothetical protein